MTMETGASGRSGCVESMTARDIDRTSSIENEPRTLHIDQIECAREAALYVMNTSSVDDALRIFTEGLQPVGGMRISELEGDDDDGVLRCEEAVHRWDSNKHRAGCGRGAFEYDHHHHLHRRSTSAGLRDIATAPF